MYAFRDDEPVCKFGKWPRPTYDPGLQRFRKLKRESYSVVSLWPLIVDTTIFGGKE